MRLVDTHCHLDSEYFPEGPDAVIARARAVGVHGFVVIGVGRDLRAARDAVALSRHHADFIAATVGVHPHDASTCDAAAEAELGHLGGDAAVVAIGEIGLDYHYDHSPRETQREVFSRLIQLARSLHKPMVIHTREAAEDTLAIMEREAARDVGGVIHCFSEDVAFARRALDMNFDISFSGIVTFKNALAIHETAKFVPLDRVLVETDSPYLAPVPLRGKPCEPAYVVHTARRVAELRGISLPDLADATSRNAERRFRRTFAEGATAERGQNTSG